MVVVQGRGDGQRLLKKCTPAKLGRPGKSPSTGGSAGLLSGMLGGSLAFPGNLVRPSLELYTVMIIICTPDQQVAAIRYLFDTNEEFQLMCADDPLPNYTAVYIQLKKISAEFVLLAGFLVWAFHSMQSGKPEDWSIHTQSLPIVVSDKDILSHNSEVEQIWGFYDQDLSAKDMSQVSVDCM